MEILIMACLVAFALIYTKTVDTNQFLEENNSHYRVVLKSTYATNTPYGSEPVYRVIKV